MRIDDRLHWPGILLRWGSTSGHSEIRTSPIYGCGGRGDFVKFSAYFTEWRPINYVVSQINFLVYLALDPLK